MSSLLSGFRKPKTTAGVSLGAGNAPASIGGTEALNEAAAREAKLMRGKNGLRSTLLTPTQKPLL